MSKIAWRYQLSIDSTLEQLIRKNDSALTKEWREQHNRSFEDAQCALEEALSELASELQLTSQSAAKNTA